jgi:hypothetical protein
MPERVKKHREWRFEIRQVLYKFWAVGTVRVITDVDAMTEWCVIVHKTFPCEMKMLYQLFMLCTVYINFHIMYFEVML